jgi:hypothetical protein
VPPPFARVEDGVFTIKPSAWEYVLGTLPADVAAALAPRRPQSARPFTTMATSSALGVVPSTYVIGTDEEISEPDPMRELCDVTIELDGGHFLPWTHPAEVALIIHGVAT